VAYKHDLFISYRNLIGVSDWVRTVFYKVLDEKLSAVLTYKPSIFLDGHMKTGTWWKSEIPDALKHSKLLIVILVPRYFESTWCQAELACIEEREKAAGFYRQPGRGLVIPMLYSGRPNLPPSICDRQLRDFSKHTYSGEAFLRSELYLDFEKEMRDFANDLAQWLSGVPAWSDKWPIIDPARLEAVPGPRASLPPL
jgi:TIR domain